MTKTHDLALHYWYVNKDRTCYIRPMEELGPDGKALCIFIQTDRSHMSVYRTRRPQQLLKPTDYSSCDNPVHLFARAFIEELLLPYRNGERGSFPFKDADSSKNAFKLFGKEK